MIGGEFDACAVSQGGFARARALVVLAAASIHRLGKFHVAFLLPLGIAGHVLRLRVVCERSHQSGALPDCYTQKGRRITLFFFLILVLNSVLSVRVCSV